MEDIAKNDKFYVKIKLEFERIKDKISEEEENIRGSIKKIEEKKKILNFVNQENIQILQKVATTIS